jgi:hypothetical protein
MNAKLQKTNRLARGVCLYLFQPPSLAAKNSKTQAPSSRETSNSSHRQLKLNVWYFVGRWMLDVGASYFPHA